MHIPTTMHGLGRPEGASVIEQYRMSGTVGDRMEDLPKFGKVRNAV